MARTSLAWLILLSLLAPVSCDMLDPAAESQAPRVVVESYQVAGEPLKKVRLTRPSPIDSSYHMRYNGFNNAVVRVNLLDQQGSFETVYPYKRAGSGVYVPRDSAVVRPGRTYRLEVLIEDMDEPVIAETTVPDTFSITRGMTGRIRYESSGDLSFRVTPSSSAAQNSAARNNVYLTTTWALGPREELGKRLTPSAQKLVDGTESLAGGDSYTPNSLRINEWPPVNESSYDHNMDGTLTIAIPWQNIPFFGPNRITTRVIDENWYDFIRSHSAQQGSGSPAEIPNAIDHVENGTGLFASYAKVEFEVYIDRP